MHGADMALGIEEQATLSLGLHAAIKLELAMAVTCMTRTDVGVYFFPPHHVLTTVHVRTCQQTNMSANSSLQLGELLGPGAPTVTVSPWDEQCSDQHLCQISQHIAEWREIAPALGLTQTDEVNIVGQAPTSVPVQRIAMLRIWKQKNGAGGTYRKLAEVFSECDRQDLVDEIGKLVTSVISGAAGTTDESTSSIGEPHCHVVYITY